MDKKKIECVNCNTNSLLDSMTNRIVVKDKVAFIPGLEEMMAQVIKMRLPSRSQVGDELMRRVKDRFEVPSSEEKDYRLALLDDYERRITEYI